MTGFSLSSPLGFRRTTSLVGVLGATAALAACGNPVQTDVGYDPAEGVPTSLGDIQIRGLALVGTKRGAPATIVAQVVNTGKSEVTLTFAAEGAKAVKVKVPAGAHLNLAKASPRSVLDKSPANPGAMATVAVSTLQFGTNPVQTPVLEADGYYVDLAPSAG